MVSILPGMTKLRARASSFLHWYSFFFSSRRRHTRFDCDWSSDVCSSDLQPDLAEGLPLREVGRGAGDDRVEVERIALRFGQRLPAARRAAVEVSLLRRAAVKIGRASCRERV